MTRRDDLVRGLLGLALLAGASLTAQAQEVCSTPPYATTDSGRVVTIHVDWKKLNDCLSKEPGKELGERVAQRISEDTLVDLHVTNFNFINYSISYKVEETVVESYVTLEKLWSQMLGLPFLGGLLPEADAVPAECVGYQKCAAQWALYIATTDIELGTFLAESADKSYVEDGGAKVKEHADKLAEDRAKILAALDDVVSKPANQPSNVTDVAQFESIYAKQEKLFAKLDAYAAAAQLVANGQIHHLGKKKAGTIVAVSLTPKNQAQADGKPTTTTEYFVHSKLPVVFHAGYAYAKIKDVQFETVRSQSQTDLFSEIKSDSDALSAMTAYLSLGRSFLDDEKVGVYLSIGTDFSDPGDRLYVGASLQLFKRFFLTVGRASARTETGVNPVLERVGNALEARELFTAVETHRNWDAAFYSISFKVF
jgi:hypothetical protein